MMGVQEYLEILRNIRDCAFATVDRTGAPAVRIIDVMLVEEGEALLLHGARQGFLCRTYGESRRSRYGTQQGVADGTSYGMRRKACGQRTEGDDRPYLS